MKYAIISDIHEDFKNLETAFKLIKKESCDKIVCLGDISGYSKIHSNYFDTKNVNSSLELIRENCDIVTTGNHDLNPISRIPSYFKTLNFPDNWYNLGIKERAEISNNNFWLYEDEVKDEIHSDNLDFLKKLPEFCIEETENYKILFSHFLFPDLTGSKIGFPKKKKELREHFDFMEANECMISFVGHAHINGYAVTKGKGVLFKNFENTILKDRNQIIYSPAVVRGKTNSGFIIFESENLSLKTVRIN